MSESSDSTNTILVVCFGMLTIIVTVAGFHVRDSVFCAFIRGFHVTWSRNQDHEVDVQVDVEARPRTYRRDDYQDDAVFEMQPRLSLPLYYEPSVDARLDEGLEDVM